MEFKFKFKFKFVSESSRHSTSTSIASQLAVDLHPKHRSYTHDHHVDPRQPILRCIPTWELHLVDYAVKGTSFAAHLFLLLNGLDSEAELWNDSTEFDEKLVAARIT